jgi:hypothetical protein
MNQLNFFLFFIFISGNLISQQFKEVELNYITELPFQASQDSQYFHLESSMMIRDITDNIFEFAKQYKEKNSDMLFKLHFKSKTGANTLIQYAVNARSIASCFSSLENANLFKKNTYDWINRSFRSNIPFED